MQAAIDLYTAFRGLYARASGVVLGAVGVATVLAIELGVRASVPGIVAIGVPCIALALFTWRLHSYLARLDRRVQNQGEAEWAVSLNGFVVGTIPDHVDATLRAQAACELRLYVLQIGHYLGAVVSCFRLALWATLVGGAIFALGAAAFAPDATVDLAMILLTRSPEEWKVILPQMVGFFVVGTICAFCFMAALSSYAFTDYNAFNIAVGERAMRYLNLSGKGTVSIERCAQYMPRAPGTVRLLEQG